MAEAVELLEVAKKLELVFPASFAKKWDKTRFSVLFNLKTKVSGVLVCLDITKAVIEKTIQNNCNLIISRHPLVFLDSSIEEQKFFPYKTAIFRELKKHKINVFSLHTNFEKEGHAFKEIVKTIFGKYLFGTKLLTSLEGAGIIYTNLVLKKIISLCRSQLFSKGFRVLVGTKLSKKIKTILFLPGSWGAKNFLREIQSLEKIDLIITSDLKWSDWIALQESQLDVLEIPHLVEQFCQKTLFSFFKNNFPFLPIFHFQLSLPYINRD